MTAVLAPYPFHKSVLTPLPMPNYGGCFAQMAQKPVTEDKYLVKIVHILQQYHRNVTRNTFTMVIPLEPSKQNIVYVPPEILLELLTELACIAMVLGQLPIEGPPTITIQLALQHTELIAHHSAIIIEMIQRLLGASDKAPSLSDKNLRRLRELKEGLVTFNIFLEKIIMYYTFLPTIDRPPVEDIRRALSQVKDVLRVMKTQDIQKFFAPCCTTSEIQIKRPLDSKEQDIEEISSSDREIPAGRSFYITQDDVLCAILGLNDALTKQLKITNEEERAHRTDEYLAIQMLEDVYGFVVAERLENVESRFVSLIFNHAKADIFSGLLKNIPQRKQQSVLYWAKRFIENEFGYDILLNDDARPLNPQSGDMEVSTASRVTDDTGASAQYRVPTTYAQSRDDMDAFMSKCGDGKGTVFFHGTDAMSGRRIIENGIVLGYGNPQQDFSNEYGFYVTKDPQVAFDWARNGNFAPRAAVLAFKVPAGILEQHSKLDLTEERETWRRVVNYNRCGRDRRRFKIPADLKKTYQKADFVEGKASSLETAEVWPQAELVPGDNTQLCILTDRMAEIVGDVRNISVCFFDKSAKF